MKQPTHVQCLLFFAVLATAQPSAASAASSTTRGETRHASGIAIVGPGPYQPQPANEAQQLAYDNALRAAQDHPDELGYPSLDAMGNLILRSTAPKGLELAKSVRAAMPRRTESARFSYKQLEDIKNEITDLRRVGFVGADVIWKTQPDELHNRIIVTVSTLNDALIDRLAEVYGTEAIAIHVMPYPKGGLGTLRFNDHAPYSGGAAYDPAVGTGCTLGFAFTTGIITAGHCEAGGGIASTVWDFSVRIGTIDAPFDVNWVNGVGTVPFPGYKEAYVNRGDLALIKTTSSAYQRPRIYIGDPSSNLTRNVSSMWRESEPADTYCTSGKMSGQLCDWTVKATRVNVEYKGASGQPSQWARNVTEGERDGPGAVEGDSGGPVYRYDTDWSVSAKGITSGGTKDPNRRPQIHYFTEIRQAAAYFPGVLKTGSKVVLVINDNSDKCLDVQGDSTVNGAAIVQNTCSGGVNQQWYFEDVPFSSADKIVNERGKCLSIDQNLQTNGAKVHQWTCFDNNPGQQWTRNSNGTMVNGYGKCLGIDYNSTAGGARVTQWDCIAAPSQYWTWY